MTGPIGASGILVSLIADSSRTKDALDALTTQAATGRIAETYAGLPNAGRLSLDLRPQIAHQAALQSGIDAATGRLTVAQAALTQLQTIASTLNAQLNSLNGLDAATVDSVAASARAALQQAAGLLDTQDAGTYVFGGSDTLNPPVPSPDAILSTGFATQIAAAVAGLGATSGPVTAATLASAGSNAPGTSPFSAALSQPAATVNATLPAVDVGLGLRVVVGLVASANAHGASTGPSTTGSAVRDLLRALATIGALTGAQATLGGFQGLISDTRDSLRGAISTLANEAGDLGQTQAALNATRTDLGDLSVALTTQVASGEDVDMAATLSKLSATQTRLQSSYQLIAAQNALSLTKYLNGA